MSTCLVYLWAVPVALYCPFRARPLYPFLLPWALPGRGARLWPLPPHRRAEASRRPDLVALVLRPARPACTDCGAWRQQAGLCPACGQEATQLGARPFASPGPPALLCGADGEAAPGKLRLRFALPRADPPGPLLTTAAKLPYDCLEFESSERMKP